MGFSLVPQDLALGRATVARRAQALIGVHVLADVVRGLQQLLPRLLEAPP